MGPPNALDMPNPISSIITRSTFGALAGAFTSKRGGAVALRASNVVIAGRFGSEIGNTVRSSLSAAWTETPPTSITTDNPISMMVSTTDLVFRLIFFLPSLRSIIAWRN